MLVHHGDPRRGEVLDLSCDVGPAPVEDIHPFSGDRRTDLQRHCVGGDRLLARLQPHSQHVAPGAEPLRVHCELHFVRLAGRDLRYVELAGRACVDGPSSEARHQLQRTHHARR